MSADVILALLPIVLLIMLGMGLRRLGFLAEGFLPQA
jgi:predicted permease